MSAYFWLAILILFLIVEAQSVTLVSVWFAAGALASLITSVLGGETWLQITLFIGVSCIALACLRPLARKYFKPRLAKTNVDAIIGTQGYVIDDIDNLSASGKVKLGAMEWTARSTNGEPISAGSLVQVDRIEGVKVFVSPVPVESKL